MEQLNRAQTIEKLVATWEEVLTRRLGREIIVPKPPSELLDTLAKAKKKRVNIFRPIYIPKYEFRQGEDLPDWVELDDWYWKQIKRGRISQEAPKLDSFWALIDISRKPNYDNGVQMYENDPFGPILARLREEGKITVFDFPRRVPPDSRFDIYRSEILQYVMPAIANYLEVEENYLRLPTASEFNFIGNLARSGWDTDTWEFLNNKYEFKDKFRDEGCLIGGATYPPNGRGPGSVHSRFSKDHFDYIGFRPIIVFPTKT